MEIFPLAAPQITPRLLSELSSLLSKLRENPSTITENWLRELLAFPKTWLFVAQTDSGGEAIGMLTLSAFPRLSGWTPWIEGVVVDENWRGQGIGAALLEAAIEKADAEGFPMLNLSSRPERESANRLYERLGFALVPTNYRRRVSETRTKR